MFKPLNTVTQTTNHWKVLLYTFHGWGKTTQAKIMQKEFGPGFIISGEAGLSSIKSAAIDYLPFKSFDGPVDEANGIYSFMRICELMMSDEFRARGYKWIMLDSLTELSDQINSWAKEKAEIEAKNKNKKNADGFQVYADYVEKMIGACKFIRDLPYTVVVSALAKETENKDTGEHAIWPNVNYEKVQQQIPGIFDHVLCGVYEPVIDENKRLVGQKRNIITTHLKNWKGKVRDEHGVILPQEDTASVVDILRKLEAAESSERF